MKKIYILLSALATLIFFSYIFLKKNDGYLKINSIIENKTHITIDNDTLLSTIRNTAMSLKAIKISDEFNQYPNSVDHNIKDVENNTIEKTGNGNESNEVVSKDFEDVWLKKMKDRFERRRSRLNDGCKKENLNFSSSIKPFLEPIWLATKYDLLVCTVPKAGSTTWRSHLFTLNGYKEYSQKPIFELAKIRASSILSQSGLYKSLHDSAYTRVMTTRHPLDRLVAAYRDKFNDGKYFNKRTYFKKLAASHLNKRVEDIKTLNFKKFIKIVIRDALAAKYEEKGNRHWIPQQSICSPCLFNYDYIMKVETYSEDLSYIFRKLGVTEVDAKIQLNSRNRHKSDNTSKYEDYFEDIPNAMLKKIHLLYKEDYELFGYEIPDFVKRIL